MSTYCEIQKWEKIKKGKKENQNTKLATTREFKHRDGTCQICIHAEEILQE